MKNKLEIGMKIGFGIVFIWLMSIIIGCTEDPIDEIIEPATVVVEDEADTAVWTDWTDWVDTTDSGFENETITQERYRSCAIQVNGDTDATPPTCEGMDTQTRIIANPNYVEPLYRVYDISDTGTNPPVSRSGTDRAFTYKRYRYEPGSELLYYVVEESYIDEVQPGDIIYAWTRVLYGTPGSIVRYGAAEDRYREDGSFPVRRINESDNPSHLGTAMYLADIVDGKLIPNGKSISTIQHYIPEVSEPGSEIVAYEGDILGSDADQFGSVELVGIGFVGDEGEEKMTYKLKVPANQANTTVRLQTKEINSLGEDVWRNYGNSQYFVGYKVETEFASYAGYGQSRFSDKGEDWFRSQEIRMILTRGEQTQIIDLGL